MSIERSLLIYASMIKKGVKVGRAIAGFRGEGVPLHRANPARHPESPAKQFAGLRVPGAPVGRDGVQVIIFNFTMRIGSVSP